MLKIGLTGGIGSGKSVVATLFNVLGIPVFNADVEAKRIMEDDRQLVSAIKEEFGQGSYTNGKLNRSFISDIVFKDSMKLEALNNLVHPAAITAAEKWMSQQTSKYVVKEAALLFESGSAAGLDYIVGVHAPLSLRVKRVIERDSVSEEQVALRMNKQLDEAIKMKLCDFVIVNDEIQMLIPQVLSLHDQFLKLGNTN